MYWMFSILVNCARRAARVLPPLLSLPFSYSSLTFVCGAKMSNSVTGAPLFTGPPPPPPLSYQPVILPSHPPDGCYIVYVPVTMEEKLTKKKRAAQNCENSAGQDFLFLWMETWHPGGLEPGGACMSACLSHSLSVHSPSGSSTPPPPMSNTEAEGAVWNCVSERFGYNNEIRFCFSLHVLHCSFF